VWASQRLLIPRLWYLTPAIFGMLLLVAPLLRERRGAVSVALSGWLVLSVGGWMHRLDRRSFEVYVAAREDGEWLADRLEPGQLAAGWDVGIIGAFSGGRVVNLEGLVAAPGYDPAEARRYLDQHPAIRYVAQYVRESALCAPHALRVSGVSLERWGVVRHRSVEHRSLDPRYTYRMHRLIFDRARLGPDALDGVRARACHGGAGDGRRSGPDPRTRAPH
ncbi:MAG: hypothetical protein R3266_15280, partial [Gemmatimonadota bacterium]|nr:hypothetical protein [Gemmatimonadota bacterium]